jgi:hypothetical protein
MKTPKKFVKTKIDQSREKRSQLTRVQDKDLARDMALAEKPYREKAKKQKAIGKALVASVWDKYPNFKKQPVTVDELSERTNREYSDSELESTVLSGLGSFATKLHAKSEMSPSERSADRIDKFAKEVQATDPNQISTKVAQRLGYELIDDYAKHTINEGIARANEIQNNDARTHEADKVG